MGESVPERAEPAGPSAATLVAFAPDPASQREWGLLLDPVALSPGETLFRQGDQADSMFLIESGELAVVLEVQPGQRALVRHFGPGQLVGEVALYRSEPRTATVEAVAASRLFRLTDVHLRDMETRHPELALALHRHVASVLGERVSFSTHELKEPLARLAHALRGLATSDFGITGWNAPDVARAALRDDEVGSVAQAMQYVVDRLRTYIDELRVATAAREAIESDLRIAGEIQQSLLPPPLSSEESERVDFAAFLKPAREAGGDLYDGFFLPDGRFFALVGDVSGKGASAALFMALAAMAVRTLAREIKEPGELLARTNSLLCERNLTSQFVTACAVILDPRTGDLTWANAGHPLPAVSSPVGDLRWLDGVRSAPLGVFEESRYPTRRTTLNFGETLVVYSDGVTEAENPGRVLFGPERIVSALSDAPPLGSADAVARIVAAVHDFAQGAAQADDITIAALRRRS